MSLKVNVDKENNIGLSAEAPEGLISVYQDPTLCYSALAWLQDLDLQAEKDSYKKILQEIHAMISAVFLETLFQV